MDPNQTPSTTANNLSPPQYFGTPELDIGPQTLTLPNLHGRPSTQSQYDVAEETSDPTTRSRFPYTPAVEHTYPTRFRLPESTPSAGNSTTSVTDQLRVVHDLCEMIEDVDEYIERKLLNLNKTMEDEDAVQQIVFHLITRARLSVKVMTKLRRMNTLLAYLLADLGRKVPHLFLQDEVEVCLSSVPQFALKTGKRSQSHSYFWSPTISPPHEAL